MSLATRDGEFYLPHINAGQLQLTVPPSIHGIPTATAGGGEGYVPYETFIVLGASGDARGHVLTVGGTGNVLTYAFDYPGTAYAAATGANTAPSGMRTGSGTGLKVNVLTLKAGGHDYSPGDPFTISGGTADATGHVLTVDVNGAALTVALDTGGTTYTGAASVATVATAGFGAGLLLGTTATSGPITAIALAASPATGPIATSSLNTTTSAIAASGSVVSNVIPSDGMKIVGVGVQSSQAGTLTVQRYLDMGNIVPQGTAVTAVLTAGTVGVANVTDDGKTFQAFTVAISNDSTATAANLTKLNIVKQAG